MAISKMHASSDFFHCVQVPVCAFECLCWTGKGAIVPLQGTSMASKNKAANLTGERSVSMDPDSPDLVIPFVTSAQVGGHFLSFCFSLS